MRRVVVLGYDLKKKVFSQAPAIDQDVYVNGVRFTVIGVLKKKIAISNYFTQDDNCAIMPVNVMGTISDITHNSVLVFQPVAGALEEPAVRQVRQVLAELHKFNPADEKALHFQKFSMVFGIINGLTTATSALLDVIGLFTLAVAGVGIMNIMLFCVQERTHEIGIMKALGARRWHIRLQFLGEALALSMHRRHPGVRARHPAGELDRRDSVPQRTLRGQEPPGGHSPAGGYARVSHLLRHLPGHRPPVGHLARRKSLAPGPRRSPPHRVTGTDHGKAIVYRILLDLWPPQSALFAIYPTRLRLFDVRDRLGSTNTPFPDRIAKSRISDVI